MSPVFARLLRTILAGAVLLVNSASADPIPRGAQARNFEAVGYSDLDGRPGFKISIREAGSRWYLYLGHFWNPGWSIVDVTSPADPRGGRFIPPPAHTGTLEKA